jgi:hypothetical protein
LEVDLRHLAPDLVRWHLPRCGAAGLLEPDPVIPLADYDRAMLWVRTAPGSQRVELHVGPHADTGWRPGRQLDRKSDRYLAAPIDTWVDTRDLWDARHADALLLRVAGGIRAPFFARDGRRLTDAELPGSRPAGDPAALIEWVTLLQDEGRIADAWTDGLIPLRASDDGRRVAWAKDHRGAMASAVVPALALMLRYWWRRTRLSTREAVATLALMSPYGYGPVLAVTVSDRGATARMAPREPGLTPVPRSWWQRLPDIELLRRGKIRLAGLHPLVRASLFPDYPGDPDEYRPFEFGFEPFRVRCGRGWHLVGWRDGRIVPLDHTDEESQREQVMRSPGSQTPRCLLVTQGWRLGQAPAKRLRLLRRHALLAVRHGDVAEIGRLLDLGLDPAGVRDEQGRDLLYYLEGLDAGAIRQRLLAAE